MQRIDWRIGLLVCCLLMGCGSQIPGDIIQPDHMEEILYDYHLSVSMSNNLKSDEFYKRKAYQDYVFKKHDVTEAEFDSSMVWYTRHTSELVSIYSKLSERFNKEKQRIDMSLSAREVDGYVSMSGDTVDAWPYRRLYWLTDTPLNNQFVFEIDPDTTFHPKDAFLWKANYIFLAEGKAVMALNVIYDNDSVVGTSRQIVRSGVDSVYLHTDSAYQIKKINGFIYVSGDSLRKPNIIVNQLSLTKYHAQDDSVKAVKDSLETVPLENAGVKQPDSKGRKINKPMEVKLSSRLPDE